MQDDLRELIESFQSHGVEFLVVGAHALALYGRPRFTEDLDLFLRRSNDNGQRVIQALSAFGLPVDPEGVSRFMAEERTMIILGSSPNAVDLLNFLDGVDFDSAWENRVKGRLSDLEVDYISREDYIRTKIASGRPKDLVDLEVLGESRLGEN